MTSGTATLQMSVDGGPFFDIDNTTFSATNGGNIKVPECTVKAVVTGDATWSISRVIEGN